MSYDQADYSTLLLFGKGDQEEGDRECWFYLRLTELKWIDRVKYFLFQKKQEKNIQMKKYANCIDKVLSI